MRTCYDCTYALWDAGLWLRTLSSGWAVRPICSNHPDTPGTMRTIPRGGPCRNFRPRRKPPVRVEPPEPQDPDVRHIALTRGQWAIVDAADYEWLNQYKWCLKGGRGGAFYACRTERGRIIMMHREIMQPPDGMVVDHIDHNPVNNRRSNLRVCTPQENHYNRRFVSNASGYIGVHPHGKKWKARIDRDGEPFFLGPFDDKIEAAKARDRKARELFGEFAYLNFPDKVEGE